MHYQAWKWSLIAKILTKDFQITLQKVVVTVTAIFKSGSVATVAYKVTPMRETLTLFIPGVAQVASTVLDIPVSYVHVMETSSGIVPNASHSAASLCTDLYGMAVVVSHHAQSEYFCRRIPVELFAYLVLA